MTLLQGLQKLNFSPERSERLLPLMESYIQELLLFNSAYNLVNADSRDEIIVRHILDSLAAADIIERLANERAEKNERTDGGAPSKNKSPGKEPSAAPRGKAALSSEGPAQTNAADFGKDKNADGGAQSADKSPGAHSVVIADIGSGGGLPGIPLAAALPQFSFLLVERMSKRCAFLENAAAILGLKNVQVKNRELEKMPAASVDIAAFRAFKPLDKKTLKSLLAVLKDGGVLAAYKARRKKINEEMSALGYSEDSAAFPSLGEARLGGGISGARTIADDEKSPQDERRELAYKTIALDVPFLTDSNDGGDRERNLVLIQK